jgi:hypothetical protein
MFTEMARRAAERVAHNEDFLLGDAVIMNFNGSSTHLGILVDAAHVVHADGVVGRVVESLIRCEAGGDRIVACYRMKGVPSWRG